MDRIGVVGTSYRTAHVDELAAAALPADFEHEQLVDLARLAGFSELVYLGTCNRVEFYFRGETRIHTNPLLFHLRRSLADLTDGLAERGPHHCLSAGCSADQLHAVLLRCSAIWARIQRQPDLARMLANLDVIPTPPAVYFDIRDALEHESTTLNGLVDLVQRDAALAAKVLKVANSGFFGAPRSISDLAAALRLVGMELLLALALTSHLLQCLPLPGVQLDKLWMHGLAVSTLARFIARDEGADHAEIEVAGVAGLLHDIGGLLLLGLVLSPLGLLMIPGALLIGLAAAAVGMAATTFMRKWQDFDLVTVVTMPLFLFSGTFYPISVYPDWL